MPLNAEILRPFTTNSLVFVETGTHVGSGIQSALDAGFCEIWSCDLPGPNNAFVGERFMDNPKVHHVVQDSRCFLAELMPQVRVPCLFWLDAHATDGGVGTYGDCPLLGELEEIAKNERKDHTILIDDVRLIGSDALRLDRSSDNYSMWKLQDAIRAINPDYKISLIHSALFPWDIMVCAI